MSVLEKQLCWNNSQHEIQQIAELAGITESLLLQYCAVTGRRIYLTLTDCRQDSKYYSWQANKLQSLGNSVEQVASALGITEKEAKQKMGVPYSMQGI